MDRPISERHTYEDDDGEIQECGDDGALCNTCLDKEAAYWHSYFGLKSGNTPEIKAHNAGQLKAFYPYSDPPEDSGDE